MSRVAAVLVTHNAASWLDITLNSIVAQTRPPDAIVVVDDRSTDDTTAILASHGINALTATTRLSDGVSRIAANFLQGVRTCADYDLVALGDHDDRWHPDRIAHQAALLGSRPDALMVASDGATVDAGGVPLGGTMRDAFPVAVDWAAISPADRMRYVLRHSIATGGASMIRPGAFPDLSVPPGWLHDRWWSLVATARDGMLVDDRAVIDYRVHGAQQVGLDAAAQALGPVGRVVALISQAQRSMGKQRDLRRRLRPLAIDEHVASAVSLRNVILLARLPEETGTQ